MLAEIKLEALEWYYMEIDYAIKNNISVTHKKVFEKHLTLSCEICQNLNIWFGVLR